MLNIHTDKGIIHFTREQRCNLPLTLNVAFKETKQVRCFLDPYKPWILPDDVKGLLQTNKHYWKADVLNVTAFEVVSRDGKESTGVIPVNAPLAAVVKGMPVLKDGVPVKDDQGRDKLFFRVRLVSGSKALLKAHPGTDEETKSLLDNIPARFNTFPKARWFSEMLSKTRDEVMPK